jgi:hypothetical protein
VLLEHQLREEPELSGKSDHPPMAKLERLNIGGLLHMLTNLPADGQAKHMCDPQLVARPVEQQVTAVLQI